ncbi:BMP family lipoprotein [Sporosarcina ureilytica]|uniref:BMP family ABC transporter substrate-binding protein n=1 Tax=Sporosarcina ureilytica TaxID=298596 RepID=A0A1D8JHM5_9BACL|nr:BMP family protein [Sporosarcina ureilytica]AOV08217.1 BMP family ABC transporter substrate-binding protein [Sporosarcina ureilytica]
MKKRRFSLLLAAMLVVSVFLAACGTDKGKKEENNNAGSDTSGEKSEFSVAMVTDVGGIDDKSFNTSAWKGIQDFGADNNMERGDGGYDYLQSNDDSDYMPNLNRLVQRDFDLIFGVGFIIVDAINEIAEQRPDTNFAIIDGEVDQPNVASILFKDQEAGYLAGVAAALMTESNKVGFVGGMDIPVIERFEAGFVAGVEAVNPDIKIDIDYTGAFDKAELGKATANLMYSSGVDIIFHASGATGNGVFAEAKERKSANPDANIWVIGVDSDQYDEGQVGEHNVTLTSALKRVDASVVDIAELAKKGEFPGGETIVYGINEDRVGLADSRGAIPEDVNAKIQEYIEKVTSGEIEVPTERQKKK